VKIVVAPDKFKGSLSAGEAAAAISRGLRHHFPSAEVVEIPIADGGEGTMALISESLGAEQVEVEVTGPMGMPVNARYGIAGRRAVMEMSAASGFLLVPSDQRDPWRATTFGTGEMILDAVARGAEEIIIGIGGSATNDGGKGMAEALAFEFDEAFKLVGSPEEPFSVRIVTACDVDNPLLGESGCTRIYGPQKGIQIGDFERHELRLANLAASVPHISPLTPGAGAAGGLGFGLMAFCGAELRPGFDLVAELTGLEQEIAGADLVITGEGSMDAQTLRGKGPAGVADMARAAGKRCLGFCGVAEGREALLERFDEVVSISDLASSPEESIREAAALLERAAQSAF
jgi:glycerate kinase